MSINHQGTLLIDSKDIILRPFTKAMRVRSMKIGLQILK